METHPIWFKRWLNPLLRRVGFEIVSIMDVTTGEIVGYGVRRT